MIKQRFITGLIILLPLMVTCWIALFIIRITTGPFQEFMKSWIHTIGFLHTESVAGEHIISILSTVLILILLFLIICLLGTIGEWFFVQSCIRFFDRILLAMPLVRKVYKSCKDVTNILFSEESQRFSKVVWVPFPYQGHKILGLITTELTFPSEGNKRYVGVVIPGTPNPTVGFLLFFPKELVEETDIPVDEGLKWVISFGNSNTPTVLKTL